MRSRFGRLSLLSCFPAFQFDWHLRPIAAVHKSGKQKALCLQRSPREVCPLCVSEPEARHEDPTSFSPLSLNSQSQFHDRPVIMCQTAHGCGTVCFCLLRSYRSVRFLRSQKQWPTSSRPTKRPDINTAPRALAGRSIPCYNFPPPLRGSDSVSQIKSYSGTAMPCGMDVCLRRRETLGACCMHCELYCGIL